MPYPCVHGVRVRWKAESLADVLAREPRLYCRERCSFAAATFTGQRAVRMSRSCTRPSNLFFDKYLSFTHYLRKRQPYARQGNLSSFSLFSSSSSSCSTAISQAKSLQDLPVCISATRVLSGDSNAVTAGKVLSSSTLSHVSPENSTAASGVPSHYSFLSSHGGCYLSTLSSSRFRSSWSSHRRPSSSTPLPISETSSCPSVAYPGRHSFPFIFFWPYPPSACVDQQQSPPAFPRLRSFSSTRHPHRSMTASSPLSVKEVNLGQSPLCLLMKWYLEKIGAESSAVRCFVPCVIPSHGKASLQQQQQDGNLTKANARDSSHESSPVRNSTDNPSTQQRESSSGVNGSLDGESKGDDINSGSTPPSEANKSINSSLGYVKSGTDFRSCTPKRVVSNPSDNSSESGTERGTDKASLLQAEQAEQTQITPTKLTRDFREGWIEARVCFGSYPTKALRDAFRRTYDDRLLRWGRLLELLDCFAGDIAYHYCTPHEEGYSKMKVMMVTASIQKMDFIDSGGEKAWRRSSSGDSGSSASSSRDDNEGDKTVQSDTASGTASDTGQVLAELNVEEDLSIIGHVTQSGSSSMGIRIELHQGGVMKGSVFFVMVAVSPEGQPVKIVPHLDVSSCSPDMQRLIKAYSADFKARKALAKKIFSLVPPDPEESLFLHEVWKKSLAGSSQIVWMKDTKLESTELIQPEALTRYNRAFGGLVARKALELSYLTAQCFLRVLKPCIRGIDDIYFLEPLYVGDMLHMAATVLWSTAEEIQIQVEAFRVDPLSGGRQRTNLFNLRYDTVVREGKETVVCTAPPVYPRDYKECISFLEARRRYLMRRDGAFSADSNE